MSDLITAEEAQNRLDIVRTEGDMAPLIKSLARTIIALHAQLADAKAAQAMVVERAAEAAYNWLTTKDPATQEARYQAAIDYFETDIDRPAEQVREAIRALADADGLAMVQELRAERDDWKRLAIAGELTARELAIVKADRDRLASTTTPSDTDGPIWHERLGWDGNKEGKGWRRRP